MAGYWKEAWRAWLDYPLEPGTRLRGRYRIEKLIGQGSYGVVYAGLDERDGGIVVVKQSRPSKRRIGVDLLRREAELLRALEGLPVPRWIDSFETGWIKRHYLVMEHFEGSTLEDLIFGQGITFAERETLAFAGRLAALAGRLHERGIVHLDLRIPNVLLCGERMVVIDFGLARAIGSEPAPNGKQATIAEDLAEIGHLMLYMLYSGFRADATDAEMRSWEEELSISAETRGIIRRLLMLDRAYDRADELVADLSAASEKLPR